MASLESVSKQATAGTKAGPTETVRARPSSTGRVSEDNGIDLTPTANGHGIPRAIDEDEADLSARENNGTGQQGWRERLSLRGKSYFAYIKTKWFWISLALGQVLSLCITGTNTFSSLLSRHNVNIPAFQTLFNYVTLNIIYTSYTIYRYGFRRWGKLLIKDGWRYFILGFIDVQGNFFTVLAYRYTTILSAQLINFWAIVIVVLVSVIFLKVRYHFTQYAGIIICVGGMGILLASDHITGANGGLASDAVKGDLFALVGATFYGLSNIFEEFLVSKRPLYEVIGQLAWWAMIINGVQAAIFARDQFDGAQWDGAAIGYLVGYSLILSLFYSIAPLMFRIASAVFFNISLLTANFWGAIVGIQVFHVPVHYLYPIAFVLIIVGLLVYFFTESVMGEAKKPWLGENQEQGVSGIGTAKWRVEREGGFRDAVHERQGSVLEGTPGAGLV